MQLLIHLKFQKHNKAGHGQPGAGQRCSGHSGEDIILDVPLGTVIKDEESGKVLLEINEHDEELILFEGGLGGRGNWHFKTSTNQAPTYAQPVIHVNMVRVGEAVTRLEHDGLGVPK